MRYVVEIESLSDESCFCFLRNNKKGGGKANLHLNLKEL